MISHQIQLTYEHRALFTRGAFDPGNPVLRDLFAEAQPEDGTPVKTLVVVDEGTASANPELIDQINAYAAAHAGILGLVRPPLVIAGGEACKNDWDRVTGLWEAIHEGGICRHSLVVAIGGGAVLDLVSFAAATAHRGIRHVRMPTTTLSQGDGGVGVKNGVNYFGKKNWVGTFAIPFAVVNDFHFIRTLPESQRRAGIIEAVKVALIRDRSFFEAIEEQAEALAALEDDALEMVIHRSAELHMNHIAQGGDPFESGSARPLDFGHWAAHKLEQISGFRIGHGDAVAIGMAVDLLYARTAGLLPEADEQRILALLEKIGFCLYAGDLQSPAESEEFPLVAGLEEFREHLGGQLTITLVTGIGTAIEVHEMDESLIPGILEELHQRYADRPSPVLNRDLPGTHVV